jgi:transposase-like protein
MADPYSMTLAEAAGKVLSTEHADVLREAVRLVLAELMEAEVAQAAGAGFYERSPERSTEAQRLPSAHLRHPGGYPRARHPAPAAG